MFKSIFNDIQKGNLTMITQFTVGCSRTVNLGNYESVRVEASVTVSLDVMDQENIQEWKDTAQKELRKLLEETYRNQYADRKKLA